MGGWGWKQLWPPQDKPVTALRFLLELKMVWRIFGLLQKAVQTQPTPISALILDKEQASK